MTLTLEPLPGCELPARRAVFSPDGAFIAAGCSDGSVWAWDARRKQLVARLIGHDWSVSSLEFSRDGAQLVTASGDRTARIWDASRWLSAGAESNGEVRVSHSSTTLIGHTSMVFSAAFNPIRAAVVTASADGTVRVWDARTGQELNRLIGHTGPVRVARFRVFPRSRAMKPGRSETVKPMLVATASEDGTARIWDARQVELPFDRLVGNQAAVRTAVYNWNGTKLLTASADGTARIWDIKNTKKTPIILEGHETSLTEAAFNHDGTRVATASLDGTVRIWDGDTGSPLGSPLQHEGAAVLHLTFSPKGTYLLTAARDGKMRPWRRPQADQTSAPPSATGKSWTLVRDPWEGSAHRLTPRSFAPDEKWVVTPNAGLLFPKGNKGSAHVWNVKLGSIQTPISLHLSDRQPSAETEELPPLADAAFSPNGTMIATAGSDGRVRLWDAKTGRPAPRREPLEHFSGVERVVFSPDGKMLATESESGLGRIWNLVTPTSPPLILPGLSGPVPLLAFNADGSKLLTDNGMTDLDSTSRKGRPPFGGAVSVWEWKTASAHRVATLQGRRDAIFALAFDEDGSILTVNRENRFQRWKVTGEPLSLRGGPEFITTAAAISPDRAWVVTGGTDGSVRLWEAKTGHALPDPGARNGEDSRHTSDITSVAFSPDGKLVVTSSLDRTARVWRIELPDKNHASSKVDQRVLVHHATFPHEDIVTSARFSPDGRFVVTTCGNLQWVRQFNDRVAKLLPTGDRAAKPVPIEGCKEFVQARARQLDTPLGVNAAIFAGDSQSILLACGGLESEHSLENSNVVKIVDFDPRSGKLGERPVMQLKGHSEPVVDVAISGDGRRVITGSADNTARVWDYSSGKQICELKRRHTGGVVAVDFSPVSPQSDQEPYFAVTVSRQDGTARVWDAQGGDQLYVFGTIRSIFNGTALGEQAAPRSFTDDVAAASFSPDGKFLVTANGDGVVWLYKLDLCGSAEELLQLAEKQLRSSPAPPP